MDWIPLTSNLGIWSGRLVIENVSLRKELFEMAGLPYEILFSCIQKMTVQVPWKSISSNPVVIELDSMLVLVVAKPRQQWEKKGLKDVERLVADLNSFIGGYLNRLIENEKTTAANTTDKKVIWTMCTSVCSITCSSQYGTSTSATKTT